MITQTADIARLNTINTAILTPVVRQVLGSDTAEIIDWEQHLLAGGASFGSQIVRFTGTAQSDGQPKAWSVILKVGLSESHAADPQGGLRERLIYQSGFLNGLAHGMIAPTCYGVVEYDDNIYWLWLEDIKETVQEWTLEDYGVAAYQLGLFNGVYLAGKPLPTKPWLSQGWLRTWVAQSEATMAQLERAAEKYPMVGRTYPPDVVEGFKQLWDERETFFAVLDALSQTFCHQDAFRRNLFMRQDQAGQKQLVAADWAFAGIGAIGEDLTPFVWGSVIFEHPKWGTGQIETLQNITLNRYIEGLQQAGWHGNPAMVQFCTLVVPALRFGIGVTILGVAVKSDETMHPVIEQIFEMTVEEQSDAFAEHCRLMLKAVDEARSLLSRFR